MKLFDDIAEALGARKRIQEENRLDLLRKFESEKWNALNQQERLDVIRKFGRIMEEEYGMVEHYPFYYSANLPQNTIAVFVDDDKNRCYLLNDRIVGLGHTQYCGNVVLKNETINGVVALETVLHEIVHARQSQEIRNLIHVEHKEKWLSKEMLVLNNVQFFEDDNGRIGAAYIALIGKDEIRKLFYLLQPVEREAFQKSRETILEMSEECSPEQKDFKDELVFIAMRNPIEKALINAKNIYNIDFDFSEEIAKCLKKNIAKDKTSMPVCEIDKDFQRLAREQYTFNKDSKKMKAHLIQDVNTKSIPKEHFYDR